MLRITMSDSPWQKKRLIFYRFQKVFYIYKYNNKKMETQILCYDSNLEMVKNLKSHDIEIRKENIVMTEKEYNIEVLCTCYSLKELSMQYEKLNNGIFTNGSDVIDDVSIDLLQEAILHYNDKKYRNIRDEMKKNKIQYNII